LFEEVWTEVVATLTALANYFVNQHNLIQMAFLEELQFTGSLGDLSFYRMRGSDKIVVRRKGGANKETIKKSPNFALPRLYMSEFGGCSTMGKEVRFMMHPMRALADYNFSGFVNKALKLIQKQDATSKLGQRAIELSKHPKVLEGFQLNKYTTFDSMVRSTLRWSIDAEKRSAKVEIPALVRDINFFPNNRHAKFSIIISLGIVPDFKFHQGKGKFEPAQWYSASYGCDYVSSAWYPALKGSPATTLEVSLDQLPPSADYSIMLSIGIAFGDALDGGEVKQIKRAGAAKVLGVVAGHTGDTAVEVDDVADNTLANASLEDDYTNVSIDAPDVAPEQDVQEAKPQGVHHTNETRTRAATARQDRAPASTNTEQSFVYTYVVSSYQTTSGQTTYTCHYDLPAGPAAAINVYSFSGDSGGYTGMRDMSA
jgi:hypothetical protein